MAIFERRCDEVSTLDDTQAINCIIETAQEVNGHTEYLLRLQRGPDTTNTWKILRRYNDFVALNKCLRASRIELPMPGKKLIGKMRPDFIAERRQALQEYINAVLMNPILASSLPTKRFVDPDSYSQSFHDQAVQNASLCLRAEGLFTLGTTLGPIGWRLRKTYFKVAAKPAEKSGGSKLLVKSSSQSNSGGKSHPALSAKGHGGDVTDHAATLNASELVLEWLEFGPDKYIDDKELGGILKSLMALQHRNIESIVAIANNENGCMIVRKFYKGGTLKDILCMATPKNPFLSKYGNPRGRVTLELDQVANYGRQILEALIFLHAKGFPYGHLHSGNVVITDETVKLLDIENYILGVAAFYRPFFVQHGKIYTSEAIDVYCFGHVLFEMAMGYPLQESIVRQINECPDQIKNILEMILCKEACKSGLPTLDDLVKHPFFAKVTPPKDTCDNSATQRGHFKVSLNAKEHLRAAIMRHENRLRDEQKSVKNQKRLVRVQELMSSEEEKRKIKHKAKAEQRKSRLQQQASLQAANGRTVTVTVGEHASIPFNRSDSALSLVASTDTTADLDKVAIKSTPASPSLRSHAEKKTPAAPLAGIERQSSSPNIQTAATATTAETGDDNVSRSSLLESICKFNRGSLRKVRSND